MIISPFPFYIIKKCEDYAKVKEPSAASQAKDHCLVSGEREPCAERLIPSFLMMKHLNIQRKKYYLAFLQRRQR